MKDARFGTAKLQDNVIQRTAAKEAFASAVFARLTASAKVHFFNIKSYFFESPTKY